MFNIGPGELLLILVIALVIFGPKRLPEIGRTIGRSLQEFRKASSELREEFRIDLEDDSPAAQPGRAARQRSHRAEGNRPSPAATEAPSDELPQGNGEVGA